MQTTYATLIAVLPYTVYFWWKIIIKEHTLMFLMFLKHCLLFIKNVYFFTLYYQTESESVWWN